MRKHSVYQPKLGVSLHTLAPEVTEDLCQAVAASGIATLEVSPNLLDKTDREASKALIKDMTSRHEVRVASVHTLFGGPYDFSHLDEEAFAQAVTHAAASVDLAAELDADMIVVHASAEPITPEDRPKRLAQARRGLCEIGALCEQAGKKIAVELLPRTCLGNTAEELCELLDGLSQETFGVCLDVNHLMDRQRELPANVQTLSGRLIALHLSDYDGVDEKHWLPGSGVIEWPAFMRALGEAGYKGPFNYECRLEGETQEEKIKSLEANFAWLCRA